MESFLVAEKGFEPHDLRVMSPTSYQTALLRDIKLCRKRESNPYDTFVSRDFKSRASACSATPAYISHISLKLYHRFSLLSTPFLIFFEFSQNNPFSLKINRGVQGKISLTLDKLYSVYYTKCRCFSDVMLSATYLYYMSRNS